MAEEIRKETEEEQRGCEQTGPEAEASCEEQTQETEQTERTEEPDLQEQTEDDHPQDKQQENESSEEENGQAEDDVVDGEFVKAEEGSKKSSFFKKKKDKKDEKIEELVDRVQRQMAEFDNFRKRSEKEKSQMFDMGARSVIEKILPVIDNFERGLAQADVNSEDPFVQGMEKIYKQMLTELESIGVSPIEAEGKEFDPNLHNAVMHCEDDTVGDNIVVQELQKGYTYHDTVVRHSMVKVAN